jgi:hypothetical protein
MKMAVSASSAVHLIAVACASGCKGAGASGLFPVRSLGSSSRDFVGGGRLAVVGGRTVSTSSSRPGEGPVAVRDALFPFLQKKDKEKVKQELLDAIAPLERGAEATEEDIARVEKIVQQLEGLNPTKEPLKSPLLNGKWKLIYTTSTSILKKQRPKALRPNGPIYQSINTDTLRAQNQETWPYFNQVTANLVPVDSKKVIVRFDYFKLGGLISIKAPGRARGELTITYLDDGLRVARGDKGNLFVLLMDDPSYRVPV